MTSKIKQCSRLKASHASYHHGCSQGSARIEQDMAFDEEKNLHQSEVLLESGEVRSMLGVGDGSHCEICLFVDEGR